MLSQLEFKLSVEKQYKDGVEKMVRLYQDEGDKRSKADAEGRRIESKQKILLLKQALKRYEDLHVDMESADTPDGKSMKFQMWICSADERVRRQLELPKHAKTSERQFDHVRSSSQRCPACFRE